MRLLPPSRSGAEQHEPTCLPMKIPLTGSPIAVAVGLAACLMLSIANAHGLDAAGWVGAADAQDPSLDRYWREVERVVAEGDFEGYAVLFHPDAVLVNGISGRSYPIAEALAGWRKGFEDTRAGRMSASVTFRFSERLVSGSTAHETGIFRYVSAAGEGEESVALIHFQSLAVKVDGQWRVIMEYQVERASQEQWEALAPTDESAAAF